MRSVRERDQSLSRRWLWGSFSLRRIAVSTAGIYAVLAILAWLGSERLIFLPRPANYPDGPEILKLAVGTVGERISARYLACPGARFTVLLRH